jgi:ABC-type glycerol-3-phosphate transport system permease component
MSTTEPPPIAPAPRAATRGRPRPLGRLVTHAVLIAFAATTSLPFLWMTLASFKPLAEVEAANPLPLAMQEARWGDLWRQIVTNYDAVWNSRDIWFQRYYFNSIFVAAWVTLLQCFTSSMAAYAFARLTWPGRDTVFKLYLATMMIPGVVTMIPNFTIMVWLHLLDSYTGLIVPAAFSAFGTFMLRQFMLTIPVSLDEAAAMDGATHWRIYWDVIMPLTRPGLVVLAIFTFMGNYGSFFWPLVLIRSDHLRTLPIGMLVYETGYSQQVNLLMAASVLNIVPLFIVFAVLQRHLIKGIQLGAVKG